MVHVAIDDLENALLFVSASHGESEAFVCLKTGRICWKSEVTGDDEHLPDDIDDEERYLPVPHKNELDLGTTLVHTFTASNLPSQMDEVYQIFGRKGAYGRFKALLERASLLEVGYEYEEKATAKALKEWCSENGLQIDA